MDTFTKITQMVAPSKLLWRMLVDCLEEIVGKIHVRSYFYPQAIHVPHLTGI